MASFYKELFQASLYIDSDEWTTNTLSGLPTCKGVLLFCDTHGRPIQMMQASNLRRTARAKLLADPASAAPRKADISSLTSELLYTACTTDFILQLTYLQAAHAVFGSSAGEWIQLPKLSLAVIETDSQLPFFYVSDNPDFHAQRRVFGLFGTRKAAAQFVDILNTVFTLCRNPALLQSGKEASCPYLQMQTCPGPCLDDRLHVPYFESVAAALSFASGSDADIADGLLHQMNRAAKAMRFEEAAAFKKKHEKLVKLSTGTEFRFVHPLESLCLLHIDTAGKHTCAASKKKQTRYNAWKITATNIFESGFFVPRSNEQIASFLKAVWNQGHPLPLTRPLREHLSVVSYFLFRSKNTGLWLDCTDAIPESIHDLIQDIK